MSPLDTFTAAFTRERIPHVFLGNTAFIPAETPLSRRPEYMTARLGTVRGKHFRPSIALLDVLRNKTRKRATVTDATAWLVLCGKNVLNEGLIDCAVRGGPVLIQNTRGEVLGYGERVGPGITVKLDRGDFLRRER